MILTLFGGVVLVVLLYHTLRILGVSNYWRGVVSGVLPLLGFALYSTVSWAGMDVLAIHTAVYLSTATLLTLVGARDKGERQRARLHWAPKAFIAFFVFVLLVNAVLLYVSSQGLPPPLARWLLPGAGEGRVHTAFPGVVPHGTDAAKEIGSELTARHRQLRLGWRVEWTGLEGLAREGAAQIAVRVHDREDRPLDDARVSLVLRRPAQAGAETEAVLQAVEPGRYAAWVQAPQPGRWLAVLRIARGGDTYQAERQVTVERLP